MKITNLLFWTGLALMLVVGVMVVSQSHAAQTPVGTITTPSTGQTTLKAYNDSYVNPKLTIIGGNFDDIATGKADASCFATEAAFNACFDLTWATGSSEYTLPTAAANTLGGIKVGSRLTITDGVLSADVQTGEGSMVYPGAGIPVSTGSAWGTSLSATAPVFSSVSLGAASTTTGIFYFYGNTKAYPFSISSQGADAPSVGWRLPSTIPSITSLATIDANGYWAYLDPATFLTPSGVGGALTVTASGFDGNLATTDNTIQEIAQKVDDLAVTGLTSLPTADGQSIASTGSGAYEWVTDTVMSEDATAFTSAANNAAMRTALVVPLKVANGTSALGTSAISSGACASVVTTTATGAATTDVINWGFNGTPVGVTGYAPSANGMLTIIAYPSSGNVNFLACNNTAASITPGAITLNWGIYR